jgi:gas vesicle protein
MSDFGNAIKPFIPLVGAVVGAGATMYAAKKSSKAQNQTQQDMSSLATPPVVEPVTEMPVTDDKEVLAAKRRSLSEQIRRRGRTSTILTDDELGA